MKLKIKNPTRHKAAKLESYTDQFVACVNWYLEQIHKLGTTSRKKLHDTCYREAREKFNLPSANIQVALDKAIEAYRSFLAKEGKKSIPVVESSFGVFRKDTIKIENEAIRLTLNGERVWFPLNVPTAFKEAFSWPVARSEIRFKKGYWYCYLTVHSPAPEPKPQSIIGVDIGVCVLAAISTIGGIINFLLPGRAVRARRSFFHSKRKELQAKLETSKNAYRALKRQSGKEQRWMADVNHKIARFIVDLAVATGSAIAIENLLGIRDRIKASKRVNRMLHNWNFRQLISFIEYKAEKAGVRVVPVEARNTSNTCSSCGLSLRANRKKQALFKCRRCGFEINADLNASRNIASKGSLSFDYKPLDKVAVARPIVGQAHNLANFLKGSPLL